MQRCLFEHLSPRYQSILQLAKIPAPWTLPVCVAAFLLGLATNLLGPANQIHVVRNPVFILIAWNLLVYLTLFVLFLRRKAKTAKQRVFCAAKELQARQPLQSLHSTVQNNQSKVPWVVKYLLPGLWHFFHRMIFGVHEQKNLAQVMRRFSHHWLSLAGALVVAQMAALASSRVCVCRDRSRRRHVFSRPVSRLSGCLGQHFHCRRESVYVTHTRAIRPEPLAVRLTRPGAGK